MTPAPTASAAMPEPSVFGAAGAHVTPVNDPFHGDLLEVSMGPHHPSTHGVLSPGSRTSRR